MQKHMSIAVDSTRQLSEFLRVSYSSDWDAATEILERVNALEGEADAIKREVRQNLPRSLFLPVSRSDLLEMLGP